MTVYVTDVWTLDFPTKSLSKWIRFKMVVFKLQLFFKEPYSFPCCFLPFTFQLLVFSVSRYVCDCCASVFFCYFGFWMVDSVQIIDMNIQCAFKHSVSIHMDPLCDIKYWMSWMILYPFFSTKSGCVIGLATRLWAIEDLLKFGCIVAALVLPDLLIFVCS